MSCEYMDRKRCYSLYFYTRDECFDCPKLKKCKKQQEKEEINNGEDNSIQCPDCGTIIPLFQDEYFCLRCNKIQTKRGEK